MTISATPGLQISKVTVSKHTVIQPNYVGYVKATLKTPIGGPYVIEPSSHKVLLSHVCGIGPNATLKVVNDSQSFITFRRGKPICHAESVDTYLKPRKKFDINKSQILQETGCQAEGMAQELPPHLQKMYDKNISELSKDEQIKFKSLLYEFSDIFSKDEFDLCCLSGGIEHKIQTYDEYLLQKNSGEHLFIFKNKKKNIRTNSCSRGSSSHQFLNGPPLLFWSGKSQGNCGTEWTIGLLTTNLITAYHLSMTAWIPCMGRNWFVF